MAHILVVCTANSCRSPVGEAILRHRLHEKGLKEWVVGSAGTWALDGSQAAPHSIQLMAEQGIDITNHSARLVNEALLADVDLLLCMESGHVDAISTAYPAYAGKVYLISEMVGQQYSVADPYGESLSSYRRMVAEITELIEKGLDRIVERAEAHAGDRQGSVENGR